MTVANGVAVTVGVIGVGVTVGKTVASAVAVVVMGLLSMAEVDRAAIPTLSMGVLVGVDVSVGVGVVVGVCVGVLLGVGVGVSVGVNVGVGVLVRVKVGVGVALLVGVGVDVGVLVGVAVGVAVLVGVAVQKEAIGYRIGCSEVRSHAARQSPQIATMINVLMRMRSAMIDDYTCCISGWRIETVRARGIVNCERGMRNCE